MPSSHFVSLILSTSIIKYYNKICKHQLILIKFITYLVIELLEDKFKKPNQNIFGPRLKLNGVTNYMQVCYVN